MCFCDPGLVGLIARRIVTRFIVSDPNIRVQLTAVLQLFGGALQSTRNCLRIAAAAGESFDSCSLIVLFQFGNFDTFVYLIFLWEIYTNVSILLFSSCNLIHIPDRLTYYILCTPMSRKRNLQFFRFSL